MEDIVTQIRYMDEESLFFIVGGTVAIVAIVFGMVSGMVKTTARERTRREIAAYIAEGSMTPEQGERILGKDEKSC